MSNGAEKQLVERLKLRDELAFREFVEAYEQQVYRLVFRMLRNEAEAQDVAQEVFLTVFKSIGKFRGDSKLGTWLYRVASNHAKNRIKYLSRRARGKSRPFDEVVYHQNMDGEVSSTSIPAPDAVVEGMQLQDMVQVALRRLPADQRELVVLRDIENLSYEEIQEITQLALGTVKSRLHRARLTLQQFVMDLQAGRALPETSDHNPSEES